MQLRDHATMKHRTLKHGYTVEGFCFPCSLLPFYPTTWFQGLRATRGSVF